MAPATRQLRLVTGPQAVWHSFSTVTDVNNDALRKEPWKLAPKLGLFDSTISNQRRGRDSNPRSSF
jgi:hypothetical protein